MNELVKKDLDLSELVAKAVTVAEQTDAAVITNDDEQQKGFDLLKIIKTMIKKAEDARKESTKEARDYVSAVNDRYKDEVTGPLEKAKNLIESKLKPYALKKLKEQQEAARIERERIESEALAEAEKRKDEESANKALDTAVKQSAAVTYHAPVRSDYGAVTSTKIVYTFEVVDLLMVPREYLMLNEALVKKRINATEGKAIPGLKISEDVSMRSS